MADEYFRTALHCACFYLKKEDFKLEVILYLIQLGGERLVKKKPKNAFYGSTALHFCCRNPYQSKDTLQVVDKLIAIGKANMVMEIDYNEETA